MRFKNSYFLFFLGVLVLVCLGSKSAIAGEMDSVTVISEASKTEGVTQPTAPEKVQPSPAMPAPEKVQPSPVTPAPEPTQSPGLPAPQDLKPSYETKERAVESVRQIHQPINERYDRQVADQKAQEEQRKQNSRQQYQQTVDAYNQREAARQEAARQVEQDAQRQQNSASRTPVSPGSEISEISLPTPSMTIAQAPDAISQASSLSTPPTIPQDQTSRLQTISRTKSNSEVSRKKLNLGQLTFVCGEESGTPATIAKLNNRQFGVILWTSTVFVEKGFDPKTRCMQVSARLEEYRKSNPQAFVLPGRINGQSVLCITTKENGACGDGISSNEGLLFTLKPNSQVKNTVEQLVMVLASEDNQPREPLKE